MKKLIHVAQDAIRRNMKTGSRDPVFILRRGEELRERFYIPQDYVP